MSEINSKPVRIGKRIILLMNRSFYFLGIFFFILFILSFTDLPFYAYHRLSMPSAKLKAEPNVIVILGGSGMPSPDGLIRCYYGAGAATNYKDAEVVIALPYNEADSLHQLKLMAHELIIRGVDSSRIHYEPLGFNTHSQAKNIAAHYEKNIMSTHLLLITSPEHMYRSVNSFHKAGFINVGGIAAFEKPVDEEKVKDKQTSNDTRVKSLDLRYNMWSYMHYELLVLREYTAILYYKIKGWC